MRWLGRASLSLANEVLGFAAAIAVLALASLGRLRGGGAASPEALVPIAVLGLLLLARLVVRLRDAARGARPRSLADLELGTMFVAATFAAVEVAGGPGGLVYPLVYALVAFLVASHAAWLAAYFLTLILLTEASLTLLRPAPEGWRLFASHVSFNLLFALLSALFIRAEVLRRRTRAEREVSAYLEAIETEAQEYRLTSGSPSSGRDLTPDEIEQRLLVASVDAIKHALYNVLGVAERALAPHTVAVLWLDASDRLLSIKELRSESDWLVEKPIGVGEGFFGVITKRKEPLVVANLRPGHSGLVYYRRPEPVTDFAGVPIMEGPHLRGVLFADRADGRAFDDSDLDVMKTLAGEIVRALQVEHVFKEMHDDKVQKDRFYEASRAFNQALNVREVAQTAIGAAKKVAQVDFAAAAVSLEEVNRMRLEAVEWEGHQDEVRPWIGREIVADQALVGAAIKAGVALPYGTSRAAQSVLGPGIDLPLPGVKVLPLVARQKGVGALVVGSRRQDFLPLSKQSMLEVIASLAAVTLANAQLYEHNERLATTDGLTGLVNHRQFQLVLDQMLAQADRYGHKLSLLLTDIDHFKGVNDTYGHPVGDKVLKRVAAIISQTARAKIDVVARYGGEEFAVVLPETDRAGAVRLAERVRASVAAEQFYSQNGRFGATISLGVATFPDDAAVKSKLIDCADQALYAAKREGRNRSITFDMLKSRREVSHTA